MQKTLQSICILGGGTAGWMAACLLGSTLKGSRIEISLIESPDIDTIGVGESTVPSSIDFIRACHIDLTEFVKATSASFKLGIRFDDWLARKGNYFHPFGRIGQDINGFDFYQVWLKTQQQSQPTPWVQHAPSAVMAENERFILRPQQAKTGLSTVLPTPYTWMRCRWRVIYVNWPYKEALSVTRQPLAR